MKKALYLFIILFIFSTPNWAAVEATVDRNPVVFGDSFILTISKQGGADGEPDLRMLEIAFRVMGTTQSTQMQMGGGRSSHTTNWQIQLMPKAEGNITIPAIRVGNEKTQPIDIVVQPPSNNPTQQAARGVILQGSLDKDSVYPGEQAIYTVKLLYNISLQGNITPPSAANAVIEKLGDDINSSEKIGTKRFKVVEQKYAIFPEQPGQLEISGALFNGQTETQNNGRTFGGMGMFRQTRPVSAVAQNSYLQVKAIPKAFTGQHWLAAEQVTLSDNLAAVQDQLEIGQSFTRQIVIRGKGKLGTQLPDMTMPTVNGLKFYPEPSQTESRANGTSVTGVKTISVAIVPTAAGKIELPEIQLDWWDINSNQQRTTTIPKRVIHVKASTSQPVSNPNQSPATQNVETIVRTETVIERGPWPWLTALFFLLWVATLVLLVLKNTARPSPEQESKSTANEPPQRTAQLLNAFKQACDDNNASKASNTLLQLAQSKLGNRYGNLFELLPNVSKELAEQIELLDACRYGTNASAWNAQALMQAVREEKWDKGLGKASAASPSTFTSLYPS